MAKKETAEQKLLKMIEASSGGPASVDVNKAARKQTFIQFVRTVNRVLMVLFVIAVLLVLNELVSGQNFLSKSQDIQIDKKMTKSVMNESNTIPSISGVEYYTAETKKRNIFQPFKEGDSKSVVEVSGENQRMADQVQNLRLVGISWFETVDSASVMIEDVDKKTTYFLMKGDKMGDIYVKTIYADSVKLGHDNEEIIIRYDKSQM